MKIHSFFSPSEFILWGLEPVLNNYDGYAQIIDMPLKEFIDLAEPIPEDDEKRHPPLSQFKEDVANGKNTIWDIPYLEIRENEDCLWKVIGHDGRHRAKVLEYLGYETMPVLLKFPHAELNEELLPEIVWCQNDKSVKREKEWYPFPITEHNFMKPYITLVDKVMTLGDEGNTIVFAQDEDVYPQGCTSKNLKDYMGDVKGEEISVSYGKAPDSCITAKKNFEKHFVPNVAYRKDNTMPANTLKEFLENSSK